jgi:hypothetical protein
VCAVEGWIRVGQTGWVRAWWIRAWYPGEWLPREVCAWEWWVGGFLFT